MQDIPNPSLAPELELAIKASINAGNAIMDIYRGKFNTSTKSDGSPVTEADLKSNKVIRSMLSNTPYRILSEEDADNKERLKEQTIWIVDPLDGTTDFVEKTDEFTVMIALVKNKRPVLGVINCPAEEIVFAAQAGRGAFTYFDGQWREMTVSDISDMTKCRTVCSRHHFSERDKNFVMQLGIKRFTQVGSSLKVGRISVGDADAYIATTNKMKEWDTAASHCIIHEAGGRMTDMLGCNIFYNNPTVTHQNGILVTNGLIHDQIVDEFRISRLGSAP